MRKPKRKITPLAAHVAHATPGHGGKPRSLTTYLQWLPVASVAVGGIIWLTRLQDAVQALQGNANQVQVTQLADRIGVVEKQQDKDEIAEKNDYSELRASDQQIWTTLGHQHAGSEGKP
jgi:hypothetical protein